VHIDGPPQPKTQSAPKPLAPPEGLFKPSVHTSQVFIGDGPPPPDVAYTGATAPPPPTGPMATPARNAPTTKLAGAPAPHLAGPRTTFVAPPPKPKKKMKKSEKTAIWIAVALIGAFIAFVAYKFSGG
jgi:hypothetical protein